MQDNQLFKEFVEFCDNQPKDKRINHQYWSTCAVGEFASSIGKPLRDGYLLPVGCGDEDEEHFHISQQEREFFNNLFGSIYEDMDSPNLQNKISSCCLGTYGVFTDMLKTYLD